MGRDDGCSLQAHAHQFDLQAPVLNHIDSGASQPLGRFVVSDAELHPHRARAFGDDVVHMRGDGRERGRAGGSRIP